MNFDVKSFVSQTNRRVFRIFRAAAVFTAIAGASQAQGLYPELIAPSQTPDVVRACTPLEGRAGLATEECGKLTLADVNKRLTKMQAQPKTPHHYR